MSEPQPLRVLERQGRLARLDGLPGWYDLARLGPCRCCGSDVFHLLEREDRPDLLGCVTCLPAGRKNGQAAGVYLMRLEGLTCS